MTVTFNLLFISVLLSGILANFSQNNPQFRFNSYQMRPVKTLQRYGLNHNRRLMQQHQSETISQFPESELENSQCLQHQEQVQWQAPQRQSNQFNYKFGQMPFKSEHDSFLPPTYDNNESIEISRRLPYQQSQTQQSIFPSDVKSYLPEEKMEAHQKQLPFNPLEQSQADIFGSQIDIFGSQMDVFENPSQFSVVNPSSQFGQQMPNQSSGQESSFVHILSPDTPYIIRSKSTNCAFFCDTEYEFPSESFLKMDSSFFSFFSIRYIPGDQDCVYIFSVDFPARVFEIPHNSNWDGEYLWLNSKSLSLVGQKFRIIQSLKNSGFYQIQAVHSRKCLQLTYIGVQQFTCNDSDGQLFSFIRGK